MQAILDVSRGALSLLRGMGVTLRNFFRKPVTVEYPRKRAKVSKNHRNAIALIEAGNIGSHNCIACLQCEKICPSACISITGTRPDGVPFKRPDKFDLDFALCSECGLCVDVCPTNTLGYSEEYDTAGYTRADFKYDLLQPWLSREDQAIERIREAERRKKEEREAKRKAQAEARARAEAEKREQQPESAAKQDQDGERGTGI